MLIITAKNIHYRYNRRHWCLEDVSFDLEKGATLGLIGSNGSGKSTLLQLVAGIAKPSSGTIVANTERITLLTLNAGLQGSLTGRLNAQLSGMLLGLTRREVDERIEDVKAFSELGDAFEDRVDTYSVGMRARLGFSMAAQLEPDVLLVDETLGVGDQRFKKKSTAFMKERIAGETTVVLVSHSNSTIRQLCDVALWLEDGRNRMFGPSGDVMDAYEAELQRPARTV